MKVQNMCSPNGREVPNQFIISADDGIYFQSYNSIIAFKPTSEWAKGMNNAKIQLDAKYWDYSTTTGKYRNQFLGEDKATTQKKINSGEYVLTDLNK